MTDTEATMLVVEDMAAEELALAYLDLQSQIEKLEERADAIRANLRVKIGFDDVKPDPANPGHNWDFPGVRVSWVKGRTTEKLDRAKLVLAGVTAEQIEKGTVRSSFAPTMRIIPVVSGDVEE